MENSSMIKIGPVGNIHLGRIWDEKGRTEIVQIFVSHDTKVHSLQFLYANDNGELVLSDRHGHKTAGDSFNIVNLNYPSEHIISVSGNISGANLSSITFGTNLETYGPFGKPSGSDKGFVLHLGSKRQFGGFHGTADDAILRSIGMHVKSISSLESLKGKDVPKLHYLEKHDITKNI